MRAKSRPPWLATAAGSPCLRLYADSAERGGPIPRGHTRWRINGFAASIWVWTQEEFDKLADRPADAQQDPCGVWLALRMD